MTKSRLFLKSLARLGLLLNTLFSLSILGCSLSTSPTYIKEEIDKAVQDISKKEYNLEVKTKLVGQTLWVYLPIENMLEKSDKPEKYIEKFFIESDKAQFTDNSFKVEYAIKQVPEEEKFQEFKLNKSVLEKSGNVWKVVRRVLFSMDRAEGKEPEFLCMVTADIAAGIIMKDIVFVTDLKKVSYEFISATEYQHRAIQDFGIDLALIGDKEGKHLDYRDIGMGEFIAQQIQQRIKLKFQKPEVAKDADIDREVLNMVIYTIKIYSFKDFSEAELVNLNNPEKKIVLNKEAVWARPSE